MDESSLEFNRLFSIEEIESMNAIFHELIGIIRKIIKQDFKQKIRSRRHFKPITIITKENEIVIHQKKKIIQFSDLIAPLYDPKDWVSFNQVASVMLLEIVGGVAIWQLGVEWGEKFLEENVVKNLNKKYHDLLVLGQKRVFSIRF
ncbi:hypothetical protein DSAG12_03850 [Promethearchaeum syntrophicum]|uniref:Uncharacterized protein n=1 Tax=Promethearchaeum syntrophicum TaxID=2594042 RepID=A0A5B9DFX6_9ARCH|nr:hypothetical protein [Candidatus Prometheoarchaeum syntrophicum]QEE18012.1 hypothetical protein DSAG12_03850 [Candidatus Prometheoarchaeum syntrophicum]